MPVPLLYDYNNINFGVISLTPMCKFPSKILKVCENAKKSHRWLQKVELGSQNVKKLNFYHLRYPDSHKDPARQKKKF